ncbi:MAG TPA: hypothetical protein VFE43_05405 [Candidatus Binataceae bacterium]|jgi:hypothetical protein|nr:hypothetical protein [Candidatus Binataceae bacterium]
MDDANPRGSGLFDRGAAAALLAYAALACLFFGRGLARHFTDFHVGKQLGDPGQCIWSLAWLPHALANLHNPVFTDAVWAPARMNLSWTTWLPLEALIALPLTAALGPVASYNFLALISLPLAAWSAFVLCRYVSGSWWAALVGGYLFGFSGYMVYYLWTGDLNLIAVFPIPLAVHAVMRAYHGDLGPRALVGWLTVLLVLLFALFTELFATATMFGVIAITLALILLSGPPRDRLHSLLPSILISYLFALVIISPYFYYIFSAPLPKAPIWPVGLYAADLYFFLLPSPASALGQLGLAKRLAADVPNAAYIGYSYLGPVMLAIVAAFAWRRWHEPSGRFLTALFFVVAVMSLGPELTVGGRRLLPMPALVLYGLPLLRNALAARFTMYLALVLSLIMALWLNNGAAGLYAKCTMAVLAVLFLLPNLSTAYWNTPADTPEFFANGAYRHYLKPGEIAVVVPYGWSGNSMLWQAQTGMYFRMAGGYTGMPPAEFQHWPAMIALFNGSYLPDPPTQLKAFLAAHQVTAVLVDERAKDSPDAKQRQDYRTILAALGPAPTTAGGVLIYRFTPVDLAAWRSLNASDLERRVDKTRFAALLDAADRYVQSGATPVLLSPARLEQMGLIRDDWVGGPNILIGEGLWAHGNSDGTLAIGTFGSHGALAELIANYRPEALNVRTMPIATAENAGGEEELELMVMTFDRSGLARAAGLARTIASPGSTQAATDGGGTPSSTLR